MGQICGRVYDLVHHIHGCRQAAVQRNCRNTIDFLACNIANQKVQDALNSGKQEEVQAKADPL